MRSDRPLTRRRARLALRSLGYGTLALAPVLALGLAPARAQDAAATSPAGPADQDGFCRTCGHKIGTRAKVCEFCGAGNSYPEKKSAPVDVTPVQDDGTNPPPPATTPVPPPAGQATPGAVAPSTDDSDTQKRHAYMDDNMAKGDYYFKTGYYLKASEAYRVAVLSEPTNPWKKLAFGHALFAIGNYSYASYALRRAVTQLDPAQAFQPDVVSLFPSKRAFEKAVKDLKRYVTYSPRDPAGLSVLGYMLFSQGEDERAKEMFVYLQRLPKNDQDPFAAFFLKQIAMRAGKTGPETQVPPIGEPKDVKPETPKPVPAATPAPKPAVVTAPEAGRQDEEPATVKPPKAAAIADQ